MSVPTPPEGDNQRTLAAVAYILTWITGLIIFFVAKKEDRYARWHAVQAIGVGIAAFVVGIVLGLLPIPFLGSIWWLLVIVLVVILAIRAYQGNPVRLPMLADMADKNA